MTTVIEQLGVSEVTNGGSAQPIGVAVTGIVMYDVVPAALAANNLATSQAGTGGTITLTAGTGVTARVRAEGTTVYRLDIPRNLRITSAGDDSAKTFTVVGYDFYGVPMTETITGSNASVASGLKAFYDVTSVTGSTTPAGNVTVGTGDVLGLPVRVDNKNYLVRVGWANAVADDAATVVVADATTATATTGDVRGTVDPSSATDASRRLTVFIALKSAQLGSAVARATVYGVAQA